MWMSVCGSAGRLTSGLHYKRKALWGSTDLRSKYKGVAVAPARNEQYKASGDTLEYDPKKVCMGVGCEAPAELNLIDLFARCLS